MNYRRRRILPTVALWVSVVCVLAGVIVVLLSQVDHILLTR